MDKSKFACLFIGCHIDPSEKTNIDADSTDITDITFSTRHVQYIGLLFFVGVRNNNPMIFCTTHVIITLVLV